MLRKETHAGMTQMDSLLGGLHRRDDSQTQSAKAETRRQTQGSKEVLSQQRESSTSRKNL